MNKINNTATGAVFLLVSFALFSSCKKEVNPIVTPEQTASFAAVNNTCKPVVLGATVQYPGGPIRWATLMQVFTISVR